MSRRGWPRRLGAVAAAGLLAGCAGARLERGRYLVPDKGYAVAAPAGWERVDSEADLAFRRAGVSGGLMAHASCDGRPPRRPLSVLARHLRFGLRDVRELDEAPAQVAGRPARTIRFRAALDGEPVAVRAVVVQGPRCVYDLAMVAPPERLGALAEDFDRFTASFALVPDRL